jgi:hypothetical protein
LRTLRPWTPELEASVRDVDHTLAATPHSEQSLEILDHLGEEFSGTVSFDRLARECANLAKAEMVDQYLPFEHGGGVLMLR